ncbi:YheC/YheD family protein [Paenibacillus sambharensis]|uniref:YheC/YheD family protein n=1 Tax=Paenibacillus sambharensis TaxID=1803190 RepID=A0A2W1LH31_9BACL|nr:YheC/YheD family protein [Paenibacillus sambharensis]PZD94352.1 YheC/YheD family protein [Paenibacillus sambharensis]
MHTGEGRQLASKWAKTAALRAHPRLAPHIPPTRIFSRGSLAAMLRAHGMVVMKPVRGAGGRGVIKVSRERSGYSYTYYTSVRRFNTLDGLMNELRRFTRGRPYMIQKGIRLATIGGRPIDYRVKYVKEGDAWHIRAMVGRLARRGLFVTNLCRGGSIMPAASGISRSLNPKLVTRKKREMRELTRLGTSVLESRFPGIGQLGFDYGIDRSGKIWIFEVNTRPQ